MQRGWRLSLRVGLLLGGLLGSGCTDSKYRVESNGIRNEPVKVPRNTPPAPTETASRVYAVGQEIIAKNPQLSIRPLFTAIGTPEETVFHSGYSHIYISEGLVKKCKTDAELAGVLCLELGKMVSEREAQIQKQNRDDERDPLMTPRSADVVGGGMPADMTSQAELARYQKERPRKRPTNLVPPPDPQELARGYFARAGHPPEALDGLEALLRTSDRNPKFSSQLNSGPSPLDGGLGIPSAQPRPGDKPPPPAAPPEKTAPPPER